jgi:hypothetical protein
MHTCGTSHVARDDADPKTHTQITSHYSVNSNVDNARCCGNVNDVLAAAVI